MVQVIVVYSGGMDSYTLINKAIQEGHEVQAISFDYGQKHKKELLFAKNFCEISRIEHEIVDITSIRNLLKGSALTDDIAIPQGGYADNSMKLTIVPNRNMILISMAIGYAVSSNANEVWFGAHSGDHVIYPDCRPEFVEKMNALSLISDYQPISVKAPFIDLSKSEILSKGLEMNLDYSKTWTCYEGKDLACGLCGACNERLEAFRENNLDDPLEYYVSS